MSTVQAPMEPRVGVLPSSSMRIVSVWQQCKGLYGGFRGYGVWMRDIKTRDMFAKRQPIARPEKRVDCSQQKDDEIIDSRQATLSTCPPVAAVPATGLVM